MNVSIMQPYLFPYLGYFQLMATTDVFVIHDDVQYIKGGWINRNRILLDGKPRTITLPVTAAGHELDINQRSYAPDPRGARHLLRQVEAAYRAAPRFAEVFALVGDALSSTDRTVAAFNTRALRLVADAIGITTTIVVSSEMRKDDNLRGERRVIAICEALGAERYVNLPGGMALYDAAHFSNRGLELAFLRSEPREYPQFGSTHVPSLSIIDVMMFNDASAVREMLDEFVLVEG